MPTFGAVSAKQQHLVTHESANGPCGRKCHHSLTIQSLVVLSLENGRERLCGKYSFSVPEGIIQ